MTLSGNCSGFPWCRTQHRARNRWPSTTSTLMTRTMIVFVGGPARHEHLGTGSSRTSRSTRRCHAANRPCESFVQRENSTCRSHGTSRESHNSRKAFLSIVRGLIASVAPLSQGKTPCYTWPLFWQPSNARRPPLKEQYDLVKSMPVAPNCARGPTSYLSHFARAKNRLPLQPYMVPDHYR